MSGDWITQILGWKYLGFRLGKRMLGYGWWCWGWIG